MTSLRILIQTYLTDCATNGKSADTLQNYRATLSRFSAWAGENADVTTLKTADIAAFKAIADPIQDEFAAKIGMTEQLELIRSMAK